MWNQPTEKQLENVPKFYSTEEVKADDKIIHIHFFLGGCDWYIAEYDKVQELFFGYANLGDPDMAEWGYISFNQLKNLKIGAIEVDRDLHWKPKKFSEVMQNG